jgi:hypothetical protein
MSAIECCLDMINNNGLCGPVRRARDEFEKLKTERTRLAHAVTLFGGNAEETARTGAVYKIDPTPSPEPAAKTELTAEELRQCANHAKQWPVLAKLLGEHAAQRAELAHLEHRIKGLQQTAWRCRAEAAESQLAEARATIERVRGELNPIGSNGCGAYNPDSVVRRLRVILGPVDP